MAKKTTRRKTEKQPEGMSSFAAGATALTSAMLGLVGGWIAYSNMGINHREMLPTAIEAERKRYLSMPEFFVNYYVDKSTTGRPLVLIHSINAGASAYEMRPLFEAYRTTRPVYALELPGFGFSERSNRTYSARMYKEVILDFLKTQVDGLPADVIALSLSSEFAAWAALEDAGLFNSLTLISPTGFTYREKQQENGEMLHSLLSFGLWSQAFYDLLTTKPSLRYFLQQSFEGEVNAGLEDYAFYTTHQPGARYAPLYFVSGLLFNPNVYTEIYQRLMSPTLVLYDRDSHTSFDLLPDIIHEHAHWRAERITPTRGLPHFEQLAKTTAALDTFWQTINVRS